MTEKKTTVFVSNGEQYLALGDRYALSPFNVGDKFKLKEKLYFGPVLDTIDMQFDIDEDELSDEEITYYLDKLGGKQDADGYLYFDVGTDLILVTKRNKYNQCAIYCINGFKYDIADIDTEFHVEVFKKG